MRMYTIIVIYCSITVGLSLVALSEISRHAANAREIFMTINITILYTSDGVGSHILQPADMKKITRPIAFRRIIIIIVRIKNRVRQYNHCNDIYLYLYTYKQL